MAVIEMKKISLYLHNSLREEVISALQKLGIVHVENAQAENTIQKQGLFGVSADFAKSEALIADLESAIKFLFEHMTVEKRGLIEELVDRKPTIALDKMTTLYRDYPLQKNLGEVLTLEKDLKAAQVRLQNLNKEKEDIEKWCDSGADLDVLNNKSELIAGVVGSVPIASNEGFIESLSAVTPYVEARMVYATPSDVFYYIVFLKSETKKVVDFISTRSFYNVSLSLRGGRIEEVLSAIMGDIDSAQKDILALQQRVRSALEYLETFKIIHDYLVINKKKSDAMRLGLQTDTVSFYKAWFPANQEALLISTLSQYQGVEYKIESADKDDIIPVDLRESVVSSPFEVITRMYGLPQYGKSFDPTPHLSLFYFFFFGICLSDFGYGLIMFLLFGYLALKTKKNPPIYGFMKFLAVIGFSTMIFGILLGSYFGDLFSTYLVIPGVSDLMASIKFVDALKSPLVVLYFALVIGAVQLIYGFFLKLFQEMKENVLNGLFEVLPWIVFLTGIFGMLVFVGVPGLITDPTDKKFLIQTPAVLADILYYCFLSGAGLIVLNGIRKSIMESKNPILGFIGGFFGGLYSLYGSTSLLGDLLSYARLLALGVATGVISMVFNFIAFMLIRVGFDNPIVGTIGLVFGLVILIGGHVFNLVISAFGAFIHSARLQYVEFFSKFYISGGKEYAPLKEEGKYFEIKPELNR